MISLNFFGRGLGDCFDGKLQGAESSWRKPREESPEEFGVTAHRHFLNLVTCFVTCLAFTAPTKAVFRSSQIVGAPELLRPKIF